MQTATFQKQRALFIVCTLLVLWCDGAFAQAGAPGVGFIKQLWTWMTGDVGLYAAAIGIAAVGVMFFFGHMAWQKAASALFGIVLVFGSLQIVGWVKAAV